MRKLFTAIFIGLLLAALALVPVLFRMPNPLQRPILYELHDASHTALFFIITSCLFLLTYFLTHKKNITHKLHITLIGIISLSFLIGGTIEIVQFFIGREASWADMARNGLGILAATCVYMTIASNTSRGIKTFYLALAILCFCIALAPTLPWLHAQHLKRKTFPVLMDFETPKVNAYLRATDGAILSVVTAPKAWHKNTSMVAKIDMPADKKWAGFMLRSPEPDWSNYQTLNFEVFSLLPSDLPIALVLYTTKNHSRPTVYQRYIIKPGVNRLALTLDGVSIKKSTTDQLDTNKIAGKDIKPGDQKHLITKLIWHTGKNKTANTLYFDNITLSQ